MGGVDPRLLLAVRDNAGWCDLIARLHGLPTATDDRTWWSGRRTPDGYPDAISLAPGLDAPELRRLLAGSRSVPERRSRTASPTWTWPATASRCCSRRPGSIGRPPRHRRLLDDGIRWSRVETAQDLIPWAALHGLPAVADPRLLDQPGVTILAAHDGPRLVGGAIATVGREAVGISNVIAADGDEAAMFARAADAVAAIAPTLPLVGYEHGPTLEAALAAGFDPIGPLRVWLHP